MTGFSLSNYADVRPAESSLAFGQAASGCWHPRLHRGLSHVNHIHLTPATELGERDRASTPVALLFEDDPGIRTIVSDVLAAMGLRVLIAHSLAALVRNAREETGALIVTDFWGVPATSLGQPDRRIVGRLGGMAPTVLMTGRVWARDETAESLGIVRLLRKPFDIDDLEEAVHACMRQDTETELG